MNPTGMALAFGAALASGLLTTVAGVGGGVALIALLAFFLPPQLVVVLVAPVLLIGNASRLALFREHLDRSVAGWLLVTALPAAAVGGLLLPVIPTRVLQVGMGAFMLVFVAERLWLRDRPRGWTLPIPAFLGVGAVAGLLSATVGGSGPFIAPFLEAVGLSKERFVGTMSASTTGLNVAKVGIYVGSGLLTATHLPELTAAFVGIFAGNLVGRRVLGMVSDRAFRVLLLAVVSASALRLLWG